MRRATPLGPITPKLLKHFAAATAVLTGLLALFASGEDWGAQAQFEAVEAKNQLVATEAEKFGTKRLAAKLKVSPDTVAAGFGDDGGFGGATGGGGSAPRKAAPRYGPPQRPAPDALPPNLLTAPGQTVTVSNEPGEGSPRGDPKKRRSGPSQATGPTPAQLEAIKASSGERSRRAAGSAE